MRFRMKIRKAPSQPSLFSAASNIEGNSIGDYISQHPGPPYIALQTFTNPIPALKYLAETISSPPIIMTDPAHICAYK